MPLARLEREVGGGGAAKCFKHQVCEKMDTLIQNSQRGKCPSRDAKIELPSDAIPIITSSDLIKAEPE